MISEDERANLTQEDYGGMAAPGKDYMNLKKDTFISYICKHPISSYQSDAEPKAAIVIKGKNGKEIVLGGKSEAEKKAAKAKKKK